jgi:hypothetical protein
MFPFGVTIPATVPQRSEIPEELTNYPVFQFRTLELVAFHVHIPRFYCSAMCTCRGCIAVPYAHAAVVLQCHVHMQRLYCSVMCTCSGCIAVPCAHAAVVLQCHVHIPRLYCSAMCTCRGCIAVPCAHAAVVLQCHVHMPRLYCSARLRTSYQILTGRFHSLYYAVFTGRHLSTFRSILSSLSANSVPELERFIPII